MKFEYGRFMKIWHTGEWPNEEKVTSDPIAWLNTLGLQGWEVINAWERYDDKASSLTQIVLCKRQLP